MSKVLWVFIQSFKIRGKKKAKQTFCFVECVSEGGGWSFFFVLGTQNGALAEQFTDFFVWGREWDR